MKKRERTGKDVNCFYCSKPLYISPKRARENSYHTCSFKCSSEYRKTLPNTKIHTNCQICNKEISYKKSHFNKVKFKTCSMACNTKAKSIYYAGHNNPRSLKLNKLEKYFWDRVTSIRRRSEAQSIPFDLDYKYLIDIYEQQKGLCYYSGLKMNIDGKAKDVGGAKADALSVDKIIPEKGYVKGNIVFCLNSINIFKGNQEMFDFKNIIKGLVFNNSEKSQTKLKLLYPDSIAPTSGSKNASGADLYVHRFEDCGNYYKVFTGVALQPMFDYYFMLVPRSSMHKKRLTLFNNVGIIDKDYSGEIIAILQKHDNCESPVIGERLVQLIPQKYIKIEFVEVEELEETQRGSKGFGSTNP